MIEEAIRERVFPAASVAVTQAGKLVASKAFGRFVYDNDSASLQANRSVSQNTLFDLASLTKPIATTTMAMLLYERGLLELDAAAVGIVPELFSKSDPRRSQITFRMLLAHSSGLPAYEKLFLKAQTRDEMLQAAFTTPLTADPATRAEYSDIGFIILGIALERLAGESIDAFCRREVFGPLGMVNTTFNPPVGARHEIPPTANERKQGATPEPPLGAKPRSTFRDRIIQGEVQDENAWVLGGVAGHAGLFSTADDVALFAHRMLQKGSSILRPETVSLFIRRETTPPGSSRTLGWDTPSAPSQSGKHFGPNSYGHLGYTGTSLWIDPDLGISITLLTNRTWPDCSNAGIKQVRPNFHNAVMEVLTK